MMRIAASLALLGLSVPVLAGTAIHAAPVPALDDGGLVALSVIVGLAAGWAVKRNKRK